MKEKETQIYKFGRGGACIYIPMDIFKDSAFPFEISEDENRWKEGYNREAEGRREGRAGVI